MRGDSYGFAHTQHQSIKKDSKKMVKKGFGVLEYRLKVSVPACFSLSPTREWNVNCWIKPAKLVHPCLTRSVHADLLARLPLSWHA